MQICEVYAKMYDGVSLPPSSTANSLQLQSTLDSALPELYAAVIVFAVRARSYFEGWGTYVMTQGILSRNLLNHISSEKIQERNEVI